MIENIKKISVEHKQINNKIAYLIKKDQAIPILVKFIGNNYCQYIDLALSSILWTVDTIENFYKKYIEHINDFLEYFEFSKRAYGEPKLVKPVELKGLRPIYSIQCNGRKNQIFIKNNDIWIKDNDYFSICLSQEEARKRGIQFTVREKMIYKNNFSPVILRGEGWICIRNLLLYINDRNIQERLKNEICSFYHWNVSEFVGTIEIFYDNLISKLKQDINRKELRWV